MTVMSLPKDAGVQSDSRSFTHFEGLTNGKARLAIWVILFNIFSFQPELNNEAKLVIQHLQRSNKSMVLLIQKV